MLSAFLSTIVYRFFRRDTLDFDLRTFVDTRRVSNLLFNHLCYAAVGGNVDLRYPSHRSTTYFSRILRVPFPCRCPSCGLDKKAADFVVA